MDWFTLAVLTAICWDVAPIFAGVGLVKVDPLASSAGSRGSRCLGGQFSPS